MDPPHKISNILVQKVRAYVLASKFTASLSVSISQVTDLVG